jgi:hypothetical protein
MNTLIAQPSVLFRGHRVKLQKLMATVAWTALGAVASLSGTAFAQFADPAVTGANFVPNSIPQGTTSTLSVSFSNTGSTDVPASSIEVTICPAFNYYTPNAAPTYVPNVGSATTSTLFSWINIGFGCWRGTNTGGTVPPFDGGLLQVIYTGNNITPSLPRSACRCATRRSR